MEGRPPNLQFLRIPHDRLPKAHFYCLLLVVASIFFSRYALTVSLLFLLLLTLGGQFQRRRIELASTAYFLLPAMLPVLYMLSIYNSDSISAGLAAVKVKGMFLVIPFVLLSLTSISERQKILVFHFFTTIVLLTAAWSLLQIPSRHIDMAESYARGQVIPTVIHHIPYSMFTAFSAIFCWLLAFGRPSWRLTGRWIYLAPAIFLSVFLHVLAVRSGLAGFYGGMLFLAVMSFTNRRRLGLKSFALILLALSLGLSYRFIPSLKAKVHYTIYSLEKFINDEEDLGLYSDSRRLISYEAALELIRQNPWAGVGIGDIKRDINAWYDVHYPTVDKTHLHPHNQYLFTAAAAGIPAALYLLMINILLAIRHLRRRDWLLVVFNIIFIVSFLVEDMLETQIGVVVYLFFNYLGWKKPVEIGQKPEMA